MPASPALPASDAAPSFHETAPDTTEATRLLDDYFHLRVSGFTTHDAGYRVTRPDPADFVPPHGVFLVVRDEGWTAVGCGGIRRIPDIEGVVTYEVKHIWLGDRVRGRGWSRHLLAELESRARGFGAQQLVLDTNASLTAAQHLYRTSGYEEIAPYNENPNATDWFRKVLATR